MTAQLTVPAQVAADPRLGAFLTLTCPEIFHSVAAPGAIWKLDPYDVEFIHVEARTAFEKLLQRGARTPPPPAGAVLLLFGEAGSGKTHLMRAFRNRAHSQGLGYCGYLQMTTEASSYARYILTNLVDSLEQDYLPEGLSRTGLARLSAGLLEAVPGISPSEMDDFREGESDPSELVDAFADRLQTLDRFHDCDIELIRVMLHLERRESRVRSRALMWLRCQDMGPPDRAWIGQAIPRTDAADPMRMLHQLGRLIAAVDSVPLVLLIDQLEDMSHQSEPTERFLKVVDAVTALADQVPNAIVVLACLEDYFKVNEGQLSASKLARLTRNPEPVRLLGNRTLVEIAEMTARRLTFLYDSAGVDVNETDRLFPFREDQLGPLQGKRARDVLDALRRHHQDCMLAAEWREPTWTDTTGLTSVTAMPPGLDFYWNEFATSHDPRVPDDEEGVAAVLASAIRALSVEYVDDVQFDCGQPEGRYLEVEITRPDQGVDRLLVAVCNAGVRTNAYTAALTDLERRAGDIPVAIVRTSEFSKTGARAKQVAILLKSQGRAVVVADADLRRMLVFEAFRQKYASWSEFPRWQRNAKPLCGLSSLQRMLHLSFWLCSPEIDFPQSPPAPQAPAPVVPPPKPAATESPESSCMPLRIDRGVLLGYPRGLSTTPIHLEPDVLTRHAAFLGGTGSGKTTAALNLIEQLLERDIPAVLVDRKGDLCRYADPSAWRFPLDETSSARRLRLREKLDVNLFTPGEPNGRPIALHIVPPGFETLSQSDRERFSQYAADSLGSMIPLRTSDADQGQRAILAKAIETLASIPGASLSLATLRDVIGQQDDALLNAIGGGYPSRYYAGLANRLLTLELNHRLLFEAPELLDIDALLGTGPHAKSGRVRLSVLSTRFLGDLARVDFWVAQLLMAVSRWCARSPQARLQAVFLFDEADQYLPATRKPATKAPMEDLLRRARSAGVGIFLATQSPGDLDYKCRENVINWLIGKVKQPTALEKLRPMLATARGDVTDKLAGQSTGELYLVRDAYVESVTSEPSLVRALQMPEREILQCARPTAERSPRG